MEEIFIKATKKRTNTIKAIIEFDSTQDLETVLKAAKIEILKKLQTKN